MARQKGGSNFLTPFLSKIVYTLSMKNMIVLALLGIAIIGGGMYFYGDRTADPENSGSMLANEIANTSDETTTTTSPQVTNPEQYIFPAPDVAELRAGGSSYADPGGVYSFLYPNDYELDLQEGGNYTRIFKRGATQRAQSEIHDGALVVFETIDLQGSSLEEYVDTHIQASTASGMSEVVSPKQATALKNYLGFTYELSGLGSTKYLVIQKDPSSSHAVSTIFLVEDPENVGYQTEVNQILTTLELLK